jgi:hypothetical protein
MWKTDPHTHTEKKRERREGESENIFSTAGLFKETKGGGKGEENDRVNNTEIHHINVGTIHKETQ